ncbi:SRPBCC domain-containing protein [Paenibacillus puerhi]|uniref:SRPBCC domain-containing protein n=1 Tax=Paenibacillus puerhi TaxID=2692622 RepID=UPI001F2D76AF|nr:SRPBCC domain-containing protein [Paenibacillus puerhi]
MPGQVFRRDIERETGAPWEQWLQWLEEDAAQRYSYDELTGYLQEVRGAGLRWAPIIADMYRQQQGHKPVGQTIAVGFNIGVRKTAALSREQLWHYLISPDGLKLWIGEVEPFNLEAGTVFESKEGVSGKLSVVKPYEKLRLSWQRPDWEHPSTLQIYLLPTKTGKTTISFNQEKLDDLYMRHIMKRHWEEAAERMLQEAGQTR